jgi:hypothetical protein
MDEESILYEFKCELSTNCIEFRCKKNYDAFMEYTKFDQELPKSFFVLLRTSIDFLENNKYKKIVQTVSEDDWNNFLSKNDKWTIRSKMIYNMQNYFIIECKISDAIYCISSGLGLES